MPDVTYSYHLGRPVRKSKIQLQRDVFSPRILSLLMSFGDDIIDALIDEAYD